MALYSFINTYSRNHLHPGFCRHFGQRNIASWKTFFRPTCAREVTSLDSSRSPLLAASCVGSTKQFSIWSKHSMLCPCQKNRERRFNVSLHKSVHCSRSLLQEEVVAQRSLVGEKLIESEMLEGNTTLDESSVSEDVTKQYCQTSEVTVDTATENTEITESLTTCTVERSTLNDTQTSSGKTMSKTKSTSQAPVTLTAERVDIFLRGFFTDRRIKKAARQHGINDVLFEKTFLQFRKKLLLQIRKGNEEMLKVFSTSYYKSDYVANLFPLFLAYARQAHPMLNCIDEVKKISDLRGPADLFPFAREMKRKIIFHAGPTNSGKTHTAIERFRAADTGLYCGPLRLLATEVFMRTNDSDMKNSADLGGCYPARPSASVDNTLLDLQNSSYPMKASFNNNIAKYLERNHHQPKGVPCDLVTGEDRQWAISPEQPANHIACTIEMCSTIASYDCAVIDEIQMIQDSDRGWAWSRALLGLPCSEIHLCGESSAINVVKRIVSSCNDEMEVHHYDRLSPLDISQNSLGGRFNKIKPGDCVVAFSQRDLYQVRREIEKDSNKKCAIIYGGLPPATKMEQAYKFNDLSDKCSVLVASDAIGMGLNLNIKRIVFSSLLKYNGTRTAQLTASQVKQIAGRAGRYGSNHPEGEVTALSGRDFIVLQKLMKEPIEDVQAAGLAPSMEQIEMLSEQLPKASLLKLYEVFESVVQLDGDNYFICDLDEKKFVAKKLQEIPLSIRDQYVFSTAPINIKKPLTVNLAIQFAECVSGDSAMTSSKLKASLRWPPSTPKSFEQLQNLEVLHEGLDLYLWLSYRFPHIFVDQESVCEMQDRVEAIIGEAVSSSTFGGYITRAHRMRQPRRHFNDEAQAKWFRYHKF